MGNVGKGPKGNVGPLGLPLRKPRKERAKETKQRASGGGRKLAAATILRHRLESERVGEAEYAFDFYSSVMRDEEEPTSTRMAAADWIANRVWGKPTDHKQIAGAVTLTVVYESESDSAQAASQASGDSAQSGQT